MNISLTLIFNYYNNATQEGLHGISARDCYFKKMITDQFEHSKLFFSFINNIYYSSSLQKQEKTVYIALKFLEFEANFETYIFLHE